MELSERLKELRIKRGLSQYDLAKRLGVSKSTISMIEVGSRQPSIEMMETLCDYFNVSMDYLRGKEDISLYLLDPDLADIASKLSEDEELYELVDKILHGSREQRDKFVAMAKLIGVE